MLEIITEVAQIQDRGTISSGIIEDYIYTYTFESSFKEGFKSFIVLSQSLESFKCTFELHVRERNYVWNYLVQLLLTT